MSHKNKKTLYIQMCEALEGRFSPGRSKHRDKAAGLTREHIYSFETIKSYKKHCAYFIVYCKDKHGCRTLEECKPYIKEWLGTRKELSAYTIKLEASALAKLYQISTTDKEVFGETPPRCRKDIKRSREPVARDKHFSEENNKDIVAFCKSTGLRRKELKALTGDCLVRDNGKVSVQVNRGKGGKPRLVPVINFTDKVVELMQKAGDGLVFPTIPSAMDVHAYRREYATDIYRMYARPF